MNTNRRSFLKTVGATAPALMAFPNIIVPKTKDKLGVALVGLGYYSKDLLAPALQLTKDCELTGIVTGTPSKIPIWQEKYGIKDKNVYNYETMHEVANNPDIDIIYIVLPPAMHAKYSIIAANAGKHVWCEKPMEISEEACQSMVDACKKNKVTLSIGYRLHHEPNTQKVMKYAKDKPFGKILKVKAEAAYYDNRTTHWKQNKALGGGAMYDMGVYPLNAIRYATGEEPIAVLSAKHETNRPEVYHEVDETTRFTLEFPSGAIASGMTSFGQRVNELHIDCEKGWYELSPFQSYGRVGGKASNGDLFTPDPGNQQARQMDDDARDIKNKMAPMVPGEEGLRDIRIVEAIYKAAKTKSAVKL